MQLPKTQGLLAYEKDDGGREDAGFKGEAGDCATRAIAIATGMSYRLVYDMLAEYAGKSCRDGTPRKASDRLLKQIGWQWVPTMQIGSGCKVHLRADELPSYSLVVRVSKHWTAVVDGTIRDTHDPSRDGTRCVYGYWFDPDFGN